LVSPNPPDKTRILTGGIERRRHVDQPDPGGTSQQFSRLVGAEIIGELSVDGERMTGKDRHAYAGAGDAKIRNVQDLPRLIAQLLLLVGLARAVIDDRARQGKDVVRDRFDVLVRGREVDCGASTGMAAIVVQLGLAMMPLGGRIASSGLTSETTSGTSGCIRQAEELSITMAPAAATLGAVANEAVLPMEKSARSRPVKSAVSVSSTRI
jgi:hypothetical protein